MGFFSDVFGSIAPALGTAIGTAALGPVGGLIGGAIGRSVGTGGFAGGTASAPVSLAPGFAPTPAAIGPVIGGGARAVIPRVAPLVPLPFIGGDDPMTTTEILKRIRESGRKGVTAKKIIEAARVCGIERAADMFGISEQEVCIVVVSRRRRRSRGISAADMRRTRSTIRKVSGIRKDLKALAR